MLFLIQLFILIVYNIHSQSNLILPSFSNNFVITWVLSNLLLVRQKISLIYFINVAFMCSAIIMFYSDYIYMASASLVVTIIATVLMIDKTSNLELLVYLLFLVYLEFVISFSINYAP